MLVIKKELGGNSMFYICDQQLINGFAHYGVKDTDDGVVEYLPVEDLKKYVSEGTKILGYSDLGLFVLNEYQLESFDQFIKLLKKFNTDHNKDGKYKFGVSEDYRSTKYLHARSFNHYYRGGFGGMSTDHVFSLLEHGNIQYYCKRYSGALAAQVSGYNGNYSVHLVLYFRDKPNYSNNGGSTTYKYLKSVSSFYSQISAS
jgi:hypothetical protein